MYVYIYYIYTYIYIYCVFLNHSRSRSRCVGPFMMPAFASKGENVPVVHYILPSKDEWLRRADQLGALGISPVFPFEDHSAWALQP